MTILDFGDIRIDRLDSLNVVIRKKVVRPKGEYTFKGEKRYREKDEVEWENAGYYPTLKIAIMRVYERDLLIKEKAKTLKEYLDEQTKVKNYLIEKLEEL